MTIPLPVIFIALLLLGVALLAPDSQFGGDLIRGAHEARQAACPQPGIE